ncbi:hypothetical protein ABVT39_009030 [Epinephelus coioides]
MKTVILKMLFIVSVAQRFGKHVYVQHAHTWPDAQQYCRLHHTDLSPITTRWEEERLKSATAEKVGGLWIGLYRDGTQWKWSGGGNATDIPWAVDEPDDYVHQSCAAVCWHSCTWNGWSNFGCFHQRPFLCFDLIIVEAEKSWEEAMWYCRQEHTALMSLASETEHLLALSRIKRDHITERVWIGLRYLEDHWLWVNHDPLVYQAWSQRGNQDHQCPIYKRCGALTKEGMWENWDCQDRLNFICY